MSRRADLFHELWMTRARRVDRMFAWVLGAQWLLASVLAGVIAPARLAWVIVFGALVNGLPLALMLLYPGLPRTRHAIGIAQVLWSVLLIKLTDSRAETHYHVFGSLAFLALYRDWKVLATATAVAIIGDI